MRGELTRRNGRWVWETSSATIYKALGVDWTKTYMTPVGRPVKIATTTDDKTGTPIPELI